jgi:hypothetical protein
MVKCVIILVFNRDKLYIFVLNELNQASGYG